MLLLHLILLVALATSTRAAYYPECGGSDYGSFIASPRDCYKYIYCRGDNSMEGSCVDGLHFSAADATCVSPEEANCQIGWPVSTDEPFTPTTQHSVADPATVDPIRAQTIVRDSCPNENEINEVVLVASNHSCSSYYLCHYGHAIELRCSQRLHFNPNTGMCDFPDNVGCSLDRLHAEQCLAGVMDFFPHADNCNFFYFCDRGSLRLHQCPASYGWDVERRACVLMSGANCFQNSVTRPHNQTRYF